MESTVSFCIPAVPLKCWKIVLGPSLYSYHWEDELQVLLVCQAFSEEEKDSVVGCVTGLREEMWPAKGLSASVL